jgi:hypothetical protein
MNPKYSQEPPVNLIERVSLSTHQFRRRAIMTTEDGHWVLLCCTVEGFRPGEKMFEPMRPRKYREAILFEDILTSTECLSFVGQLQEGRARFGDIYLEPYKNTQWTTTAVSASNDYMECAGYVIGLNVGESRPRRPVETLLTPDEPYYPDVYEAASDWLPFPVYHGHNDGRHNQVFFLLPETRAFIANAALTEKDILEITIGGTDVSQLSLFIKGAYWVDKAIHHFETDVTGSKAVLAVSAGAHRLEYYLLDRTGTVYGFHREDRYTQSRLGGNVLGTNKRKLRDQVREAANAGEGTHVEFKPFIDPKQKHELGGQKSKLGEIVITVAAFANTGGGNIYLGIDDDCSISGIDRKLGEWAKSEIDDSVIDRYLGELRSKIKDVVIGEVTLRLSCTAIDGVLVATIEVPPATNKPITIRQDNYLYARMGASNRKVPPDQWMAILASNKSEYF